MPRVAVTNRIFEIVPPENAVPEPGIYSFD